MAELFSDLSEVGSVHCRPHSLGRHLRETVRSLWGQSLSVVAAERSPLRVSAFRVRQGFALSQFTPVGGSVVRGFRGRGENSLACRIRSFKVNKVTHFDALVRNPRSCVGVRCDWSFSWKVKGSLARRIRSFKVIKQPSTP